MRIALISDTHLAAKAHDFVANCQAAIGWVRDWGADLVIHLGDISADGIEAPHELDEAADILAAIDAPLLCVPGNHDVGDNPTPGLTSTHGPFDPVMLARFRRLFGADRWSVEASGWTLIGLNAQLFATASTEESEQFAWLEAEVARSRLPIGLFLHKPWFRDTIDEAVVHSRYVPHGARARLADLVPSGRLRFVASGHTHQARRQSVAGVEHVWVPSTAFVIPDSMQERIGEKRVGLATLTLDDGACRLDHVVPDILRRNDLGDYADIFPKIRAVAPR